MVRRRYGQISRRKIAPRRSFSRRPWRLLSPVSTPSPLFLRGKQRLSAAEQSRAFVRGFQPDLWSRISQRLQLKLPGPLPQTIPTTSSRSTKPHSSVLHGTPSTLFDTAFATYPSCRIDDHIELDIGVARSKLRTSLR